MGKSTGPHWNICFMERKEKKSKGAERSKKQSVRSAKKKEEYLTLPLRVTMGMEGGEEERDWEGNGGDENKYVIP